MSLSITNTTLLLLAIAGIMLAALPVVMLLKAYLPTMIQRTAGVEQLENRIYVLHSENHEMQDRIHNLTTRRNQVVSDKHRLETEIRKVEKIISDLANEPPLFIHEVGDPQMGMTKFKVNIQQDAASAMARAGGEKAAVNPIWRHTNVAEVWAWNFEEAKQLVEVAFPFKMGFQKSFQRAPAPKAAKAPSKASAS